MFFINHELASKQYAFAIALAIAFVGVRMFWSLIHLSFSPFLGTKMFSFHLFLYLRFFFGAFIGTTVFVLLLLCLNFIYLCLARLPLRTYFVDNVCKQTHTHSMSYIENQQAHNKKPHQQQQQQEKSINKTKIGFGTKAAVVII